MDVLCLYITVLHGSNQEIMCRSLMQHLLSFFNGKATPRVLFSTVYDSFSVDKPDVNISSWRFNESPPRYAYGYDSGNILESYDNINDTIQLKLRFVHRLFSDMDRVRKNVTHVAVMFLQGKGLSNIEMRTVPHILLQQDTSIKVFVVVLNAEHESHIVHLWDTIIVANSVNVPYKHLLALAMCNQCLKGSWQFEHSVGAESVSCYTMLRSPFIALRDNCKSYNHSLEVTIESTDELYYLKDMTHSYFQELSKQHKKYNVSTRFYIGLRRDTTEISQRFRWEPFSRPLIVHNWMPGSPSKGHINECVVWQFDNNQSLRDASSYSLSGHQFDDGWLDINCKFERSFSLCEASIPRRIENNIVLGIKSATSESFSRALNSGGFAIFRDNIVSVSFNFASKDFQTFLQQTSYELFPLFDCGLDSRNQRYISYSVVCDGLIDCNNMRDEDLCLERFVERPAINIDMCRGIHCCNGSCLLLQWVQDGEIDCPVCDYSTSQKSNDESDSIHKHLKRNETCAFICNDNKCITISQLNNGHVDCTGREGPLDETIGKLKRADICTTQSVHVWAPSCVYVRDIYGAVLGCRDMSHLENCTHFECSIGYFKCLSTYCIPQHYILDGRQDCPTGEDEQTDNISPCKGNFACWDSKVCLHPDLVCDGHPDCPRKDDEVDCGWKCVEGFRCVSGTVTLSSNTKPVSLARFPKFDAHNKYLDMSNVDLSEPDLADAKLPNKMVVVKWSNCQIRLLSKEFLNNLYFLKDVDLSYNDFQVIDGRETFFDDSLYILRLNLSYNTNLVVVKYLQFDFLEMLDLSHTSLSHLDGPFFKQFPVLKHLDFSFTYSIKFHKDVFPSDLSLQTLDLRGIPVENFYEDLLNGLTISQHLYTDSFKMCCPQIRGNKIPYYLCHSPVDAISSCFDLVRDNVQRVLLWVTGVLIVLENIAMVVYSKVWDLSAVRTSHRLFVTNLAISDFIMAVYLFIIAGVDIYFRDNYVLYDTSWRESVLCRLAGLLSTLSSELSNFFIILIIVDRYLEFKFSMRQVTFSKRGKIIVILLSWLISFLLALTPIVFGFEMYSFNAMCNAVGLHLTNRRLKGWEFSFWVFIVLSPLLSVIVDCVQRVIQREIIKESTKQTAPIKFSQMSGDLLTKQLNLLAVSNFLFSFSLGCMGVLTVFGHEINNDVYAWITVVVFPLKSAANPLVYIIPVLKDKWDKFRFRQRKVR